MIRLELGILGALAGDGAGPLLNPVSGISSWSTSTMAASGGLVLGDKVVGAALSQPSGDRDRWRHD